MEPVTGSPRTVTEGPVRALARNTVAAALLMLLAGCATKGGFTTTGTPTATASASQVLALGQAYTTSLGNRLTTFAFERSVTAATPPPSGTALVAAEVEVCAGANPSARTGSSPTLFFVETDDGTAHRSVTAQKTPPLKIARLDPNACERGWVTFAIPDNATPSNVVFISREVAKWRIA